VNMDITRATRGGGPRFGRRGGLLSDEGGKKRRDYEQTALTVGRFALRRGFRAGGMMQDCNSAILKRGFAGGGWGGGPHSNPIVGPELGGRCLWNQVETGHAVGGWGVGEFVGVDQGVKVTMGPAGAWDGVGGEPWGG